MHLKSAGQVVFVVPPPNFLSLFKSPANLPGDDFPVGIGWPAASIHPHRSNVAVSRSGLIRRVHQVLGVPLAEFSLVQSVIIEPQRFLGGEDCRGGRTCTTDPRVPNEVAANCAKPWLVRV